MYPFKLSYIFTLCNFNCIIISAIKPYFKAIKGVIMKVCGIVAEYNPFHNGHQFHIDETKRLGATHVVAVMSGNFVQRSEPAIISKFERARLAVLGGIDLVVELPVQY